MQEWLEENEAAVKNRLRLSKRSRKNMSRPKYYWYSMVKKMVMKYPQIKEENSIQTSIYVMAIEKSLEETGRLQNGEERVKAIRKIYFERKKTYAGVAQEMNYSERTIRNWTSSFINLCGKNAGF